MALPLALPLIAKAAGALGAKAAGAKAAGGLIGSIGGSGGGGNKPTPLGIAYGIGQGINSLIKRKKAKGLFPEYEDQGQKAMKQNVANRLAQLDTGVNMRANQNALAQQGASMARAAVSSSGGAGGAAQNAMKSMYRAQGRQLQQLNQQNDAQRTFYTNVFKDITDRMAQRRLDLRGAQYSQMMAESAQAGKEAKMAILGGLSRMGGGGEQTQMAPMNGTMKGVADTGSQDAIDTSGEDLPGDDDLTNNLGDGM